MHRLMQKMCYVIIHLCEKSDKCKKSEKSEKCKKIEISRIKKPRNLENLSFFLQFAWFFTFYGRIFLAMKKKARNAICEKWEMLKILQYEKSYFLQLIACKKCEKIKKFEKCDNYISHMLSGAGINKVNKGGRVEWRLGL